MKNLKMFAIAVMAFAVMAMGVHAECAPGKLVQGEKDCYTDLAAAISTGLTAGDTKFTLLDNATLSADLTITKNVTIDLGTNNITFSNSANGIVVSGGNLTLTGTGYIASAANATKSLITVNGGHSLTVNGVDLKYTVAAANKTTPAITVNGDTTAKAFTNVTFDKDVKVTSDGYGLAILGTSAPKVTVNMAGTWETKDYVVKVNGTVAYSATNAPEINIASGTYTSTDNTALYASGYAKWNISGGDITGAQALEVRSGVVDIKGGTLKATGDYSANGVQSTSPNAIQNGSAIVIVDGTSLSHGTYVSAQRIDVKVSGGTVNSENGYAMYIKNLGENGKVSIPEGSTAKFTSANDNRGQLAAIKIDEPVATAKKFIENHGDMVQGGTFTGDVFEELAISEGTVATSEELAKDLVKGEVNTGDGNTTVEGEGENQGNTENNGSENQGNQGGTENVKNPDTNDNILVYAGLGLVSLASVAFTAKKRED